MIRISKETDYGIVLLSCLAREPGVSLSATALAERGRLPLPTVSKILKALGRHGLVQSQRGTRGGYVLSRPPTQISIADLIDALEEHPFGLTECSANSGTCNLETGCRIRDSWIRINTVVRQALQTVSVAEMTPAPSSGSAAPATEHRMRGPDRLARHAG